MHDFYAKNGYLLVPAHECEGFFRQVVMYQAKDVYQKQLDFLGINGDFDQSLFDFFDKDRQRYINTSRTVQNIPALLDFCSSGDMLFLIRIYSGIKSPVVQKPFLHMNCKRLAVEQEYYVFPPHQDYSDDQGSLNAVVAYVALVDINKDLGALQVAPGSHLLGLLPTRGTELTLDTCHAESMQLITPAYEPPEWVDVEMKTGDILLMSSFLLHRSGVNVLDRIRWACVFRYNDLADQNFIERGYPNQYVQRSLHIVDESYPYADKLKEVFKNG